MKLYPLLAIAPVFVLVQPVTPRPFVLDSVTAPNSEINASFTPNQDTVYFTKSDSAFRHSTIYESHRLGGRWSAPTVAPFSGTWKDSDPDITPDGRQLFFISNRPAHAGDTAITAYDIWVVEREQTGGWTAPRRLDATVNGPGYNMYPSVTSDGSMYFTFVPVGQRVPHLYRARLVNGRFTTPERLPFSNGAAADFDGTVPPDGRFIVFASSGRSGIGKVDLFVSYRHGDQWTTPVNLGAPINSSGNELATGLSRDQRTLYFSSDRDGMLRIYQAAAPEWRESHAPNRSR